MEADETEAGEMEADGTVAGPEDAPRAAGGGMTAGPKDPGQTQDRDRKPDPDRRPRNIDGEHRH